MQHLDEGTIHSWLDGALSADEAAGVQAHVGECRQCAAAVAEARGFIAASSRILTALDNAPRGVIPVVAPVKRVNPLVWRVAATVLVVAAGTLVVVQNRESTEPLKAVSEDQNTILSQPTEEAVRPGGSDAATSAAANADLPKATVSKTLDGVLGEAPGKAPAAALSEQAKTGNARRDVTMADSKASTPATIVIRGRAAGVASDRAAVPAPAPPTIPPSPVEVAAAMDAAAEPRLKVVGSPRQLGAKVTLYEVAPGDTVTLTESMPIRLESVVATGAAGRTQMMAPQATAKSVGPPSTTRADAAKTAAPESQRAAQGAASAPAVPPSPMLRPGSAIMPRSITWSDPVTGNRLTLTGRIPESRLQEIRIRIDRERAAAAAAAKKNP